MAKANFSVRVVGDKALQRRLKKMNPAVNQAIMRDGLTEAALDVQANAALKQIAHGRGSAPPLSNKLTSRHGGHGLVGSIRVDRKQLPFAIEVGSDKVYGQVHERGLFGYPVRAFMGPALKAVQSRFPAIINKHWKKRGGI